MTASVTHSFFLDEAQLSYLRSRFENAIRALDLAITNAEEMLEELVFGVKNFMNKHYPGQRSVGFSHAVNRCLLLVKKRVWRTPFGFLKYTETGRAKRDRLAAEASKEKRIQEGFRTEVMEPISSQESMADTIYESSYETAHDRIQRRYQAWIAKNPGGSYSSFLEDLPKIAAEEEKEKSDAKESSRQRYEAPSSLEAPKEVSSIHHRLKNLFKPSTYRCRTQEASEVSRRAFDPRILSYKAMITQAQADYQEGRINADNFYAKINVIRKGLERLRSEGASPRRIKGLLKNLG